MKYSVAALLLGVIATTQATEQASLAKLTNQESLFLAMEESESDDSEEDSLVQLEQPCEYLDETQDELDYQVDMFSRTLDPRHWTNVVNISKAMEKSSGKAPRL